jgi:hypothetical protein
MVTCDITANEAGHHYEEFIYFPLPEQEVAGSIAKQGAILPSRRNPPLFSSYHTAINSKSIRYK